MYQLQIQMYFSIGPSVVAVPTTLLVVYTWNDNLMCCPSRRKTQA